MELTSDLNEEFIDVPDIAEPPLPPLQISRIGRTEFSTPVSDRFIGDKDSSLREQVFYVSKTQGEPVVQPSEVACRLGDLLEAGQAHLRGFHPSAIVGSLAAAAAVARFQGLEAAAIADCVGLAASLTAGLFELDPA